MAADQLRVTAPAPRPRWLRFLPLIGLFVLGWVLSRLDLHAIGAALGRVSLTTLLACAAFFSFNLWLKVLRWQRLLAAQGIRLPHRVALAAFMSAQFYAQITVGRVGEFVRIEALIERGVKPASALSSCVFDRLLDVFLVLFAGSVLGAFVLGHRRVAWAAALSLVALATLATGFLIVLGRRPAAVGGELAPTLVRRLRRALHDLASGMLPMLRARPLIEAAFWTAGAWTGYFAALFALADGLGLSVSRLLLTATASFAALSALLPVSVSGLGARELIYIEVLRSQGVANEAAVALSLLHLAVMTLVAVLLGLIGVVWRQRQRPDQRAELSATKLS
jgi:uncharacterized protein (TIRG00374 family)